MYLAVPCEFDDPKSVWKECKQSHCRRRRKPAFPNCEPIDEQLSDNVLSMFIFVWFLRYTLQ